MKIVRSMFLVVAATLLVGCQNETKKAGGPGATAPDKDRPPVVGGPAENTFTLDPPNFETNITQGESKVVKIGINRGKNFDQDVTLSLDNVPQGLTVEPSAPVIKKGDKEVNITLKAADDAALGHHVIKLTGKPATGNVATNDLKVEVKKK